MAEQMAGKTDAQDLKVLYLTPWYPSERDAMAGLFVQKHVDAVRGQGVDVRVIHSQGWCDLWHQWRQLKGKWGLPDVVQLNVIQKQGLLALWLKRRYNIPYVIVEHWSGYLPENGQYMQMPNGKIRFARHVCENAAFVLTVSRQLLLSMQQCGLKARHWETIDNVVDDFFYQKSDDKNQMSDRKRLLHVSCFDEQAKNIKGLLRAIRSLADKRQDFELVLVGTGADINAVSQYAHESSLDQVVHFVGEQTPQEVAEWMHQSDALVLSSRYETYGIVLAEAAAAGLPIISTPVGIAEDLSTTLVAQDEVAEQPKVFAEKIEHVLFTSEQEVSKKADTQRFTATTIGKKLKQIYEQALTQPAMND